MLFDKKKFTVTISGGSGSVNTTAMRGMIENLMIIPTTSSTVYDVTFTDRDGDVIYSRISETGRLDDTSGLAIGLDTQEKLTIAFANVSANETIKIIFKIREQL